MSSRAAAWRIGWLFDPEGVFLSPAYGVSYSRNLTGDERRAANTDLEKRQLEFRDKLAAFLESEGYSAVIVAPCGNVSVNSRH